MHICLSVSVFPTTGPLVTFLIHHPPYILDWLSFQSMEKFVQFAAKLISLHAKRERLAVPEGTCICMCTWGCWAQSDSTAVSTLYSPPPPALPSCALALFVLFELKLKEKIFTILNNKYGRERLSRIDDYVCAACRQKKEAAWLPWNEFLRASPQRRGETLTQTPKWMPIAWQVEPHMCWQAHGAKICPDL